MFMYFSYDLSLSFEESVFGGRKEISITCFETCDSCNGTGAKSTASINLCVDCGGRGGVMRTQRTPFGVVSQVIKCIQWKITLLDNAAHIHYFLSFSNIITHSCPRR